MPVLMPVFKPSAVTNLSDRHESLLVQSFLTISARRNKDAAEFAQRIYSTWQVKGQKQFEDANNKLLDEFNTLPEDQQIAISGVYAKMTNLARMARKNTAHDISKQREERFDPRSADQPSYVFQKIKEEEQRRQDEPGFDKVEWDAMVKSYIQTNMIMPLALTMHPTKPYSVAYAKAQMKVDEVLNNPDANPEELEEALKELDRIAITSEKKTVKAEIREVGNSLNQIYKHLPDSLRHIQKEAEDAGYGHLVDIETVIIDLATWAGGDGDGNEKVDRESIEVAINSFQAGIRKNFRLDLEAMKEGAEFDTKLQGKIDEVIKQLAMSSEERESDDWGPYFARFTDEDLQELKAAFKAAKDLDTPEFKKQAEDFIIRASNFKLTGSKIDIRHNSLDFVETVLEAGHRAGLLSEKDYKLLRQANDPDIRPKFREALLATLETELGEWLSDPEKLEKLKRVEAGHLKNATAQRIWGRLQAAAKAPHMFKDVITAETEHPAHALANLVALKATKNDDLNVVTLTESAEDLQNLKGLLKDLMKNPHYEKHVRENQKNTVTVMVAKSDTVRQDGLGATRDQVRAMADAVLEMHKLGVQVQIYSGGGAAIVRGGGRLDEIPHQVHKGLEREIAHVINEKVAAMNPKEKEEYQQSIDTYGEIKILPVKTTVQGHQVDTVFGGDSHVLTQYVMQNLYAAMQTSKALPSRPFREDLDAEAAYQQFDSFAAAAKKGFRQNMFGDDLKYSKAKQGRVDTLMEKGAALSVTLGNLASRAVARGLTTTSLEGWTWNQIYADIIGKKAASQQRAITNDKTAIHTGTAHTGYLGVKEGLEAMIADHGKESLHHLYLADKDFRDMIMKVAMSLSMTNFDKTRDLLGPKTDANAADYDTIDWLEEYATDTAKLVYQTILNKEPPKKRFSTKTPLADKWPDVAYQMFHRDHRQIAFGEKLEAQLNRDFREAGDETLTKGKIVLFKNAYAANDTKNTAFLNNEVTRSKDEEKKRGDVKEGPVTPDHSEGIIIRELDVSPGLLGLAESLGIRQKTA